MGIDYECNFTCVFRLCDHIYFKMSQKPGIFNFAKKGSALPQTVPKAPKLQFQKQSKPLTLNPTYFHQGKGPILTRL